MNLDLVEKIAAAVLYEGYILYPYRPSAIKNQQRWNFGALHPQSYALASNGTDAWTMQTECLVQGDEETTLDVKVRFLHMLAREVGVPIAEGGRRKVDCDENEMQSSISDSSFQVVASLEVGGQTFHTWQEATEREVSISNFNLSELVARPKTHPFTFQASHERECLGDASGQAHGVLIRRQQSIEGEIELKAERVGEGEVAGDGLFKFTVRVLNVTPFDIRTQPSRDDALMRSCVSTHTVLGARGGAFVSSLDPPEECREAAAKCQNIGTYPVLVGEEGERDCILSSPIILYDYPQISPESAGDFFDGTEIDEMLTLRIMTLTDAEKGEMRGADEHARRMLERTESLPAEQMMKLHGRMKGTRQT